MLICKGDAAFKCSKLKTEYFGETQHIKFELFDSAFPEDVKNLFSDNTFYFYDELLKGRMFFTDNTNLVGLRIVYDAESTYKITIKLTKGVVDGES